MKPILIIGRARCGKTIVAQALYDMGFYLPTSQLAPNDFEAICDPACSDFFTAITCNDVAQIKKQFSQIVNNKQKIAFKSHMLIYAWPYVDAKIIVCHRRDKYAQAESIRGHVRNESIESLLENLKWYDAEIAKIPERLDWYLEDYWENPEKELQKLCDFVGIAYDNKINRYTQKLVGK